MAGSAYYATFLRLGALLMLLCVLPSARSQLQLFNAFTTPEPNTEISEDDFPAQFLCDIFSLLDEVMVNTSWFIEGTPIALFSSNVTFELSGERTRNLTILSGFPAVVSCGVPQDVFLANFTIIESIDMPCDNLDPPVNGSIAFTNETFIGSVATYSCQSAAFRLVGVATRICTGLGWTEMAPTCQMLADCGNLSAPANGNVTLMATTEDSLATYTCDLGYSLNGPTVRACQATGEWTGFDPTCEFEFPVSIGFVETSLQVLEGQSIDVCVELVVLQPPEIFPVEVFFDVDSLETTASMFFDFTINFQVITFPIAETGTVQCVTVDTVQDTETEGVEVVQLRIGSSNPDVSFSTDIAVISIVECIDNDVRLVRGTDEFDGRVEFCSGGVWGTVCDDSWDDLDAMVVCRQLGFPFQNAVGLQSAFFGLGVGDIFLDDVSCSGNESLLANCTHLGIGNHNCDHSEDASVDCLGSSRPPCNDTDVRLLGGTEEFDGRVEFCSGGVWGTVCDDLWDDLDAMVVCRQLGFPFQNAVGLQSAFFGEGVGDIFLDDVSCSGNEPLLANCTHRGIGIHDCSHSEDASVDCLGRVPVTSDPPPLPGSCVEAGFVGCCDGDFCMAAEVGVGEVGSCHCDFACFEANDCCADILSIGCFPSSVSGSGSGSGSGSAPELLVDCFPGVDTCQEIQPLIAPASICCSFQETNSISYAIADRFGVCVSCNDYNSVVGFEELSYFVDEGSTVQVCVSFLDDRFAGVPLLMNASVDLLSSFATPGDDFFLAPTDPLTVIGPGSAFALLELNDNIRRQCFSVVANTDGIAEQDQIIFTLDIVMSMLDPLLPPILVDSNQAFVSIIDIPQGSCVNAGFVGCCDAFVDGCSAMGSGSGSGSGDQLQIASCFCDQECYDVQDCCSDIADIGCLPTLVCHQETTACNAESPLLLTTAEPCCNGNFQQGPVPPMFQSYSLIDRPFFCISCTDFSNAVGFEQLSYTATLGDTVDVCVSFLDGRFIDSLVQLEVNLTVRLDLTHPGVEFTLFQGSEQQQELISFSLNAEVQRQCFTVLIQSFVATATGQDVEIVFSLAFFSVLQPGQIPVFIDPGPATITIRDFCGPNEVQCLNEDKCIPLSFVCDGIPDCTEVFGFATEETNCPEPGGCTNGDSRLIGGATSAEGLLETCFNGVYRPVNAEEFTVLEASTVCRQLAGAVGARGLPVDATAEFNFASTLGLTGSSLLTITCQGGENGLADCSIEALMGEELIGFGRQAGVRCVTDAVSCSNGDVRLVGGSAREGRLEICYEGVWGSVSDGILGFLEASVVCQQLGFPGIGALPVFPSTYPGTPSPPILESPVCSTGNESSLIDCRGGGSALGVIASMGFVGVKCDDYAPVGCSDLEVRLTHRDRTGTNGQLQICDASVNATGVWGTACSMLFFPPDAEVVISQLGCLLVGPVLPNQAFPVPIVSPGSGPVFEREPRCSGSEQNLTECSFDDIGPLTKRQVGPGPEGDNDCNSHQNDVSIICGAPPVLIFMPPSPDDRYVVELGRPLQVHCTVAEESFPAHSMLSAGNDSNPFEVQIFSTEAITPKQAGVYSCTASSTAGITTRNITVVVLGPAEGQPPDSSAFIRSSIPLSISQSSSNGELFLAQARTTVLNLISVDYPGVQTVECRLLLPRAIELARGLDRFECMISQFATSQDQPPIISARQIAMETRTVVARLGITGLTDVSDFRDLDAQLEMLVNSITVENYEAVVSELSVIADESVVAVEEQTEPNLDRIATAFNSVASLVANSSALAIVDNTIVGLVETLSSILQWDPETLASNGSDIVENFELIAVAFADRGEGIDITTPDIAFVTENQDTDVLQNSGRSFSFSDSNGVPNPTTGPQMASDTLAPTQTAFINLPPTLFDSVPENRTTVGLFFAVYNNPSLFPVAEAEVESTTRVITVLSPVVAATATVGPGLTVEDAVPSVRILLRLRELGEDESMAFRSERCVSWDFEANGGEGNWTTEGCETIGVEDGVVTCQCSHLTNFAILVEICSGINSRDCVIDLDPELEMLVNNVTAENYEAVVSELSSIAEQSVVAEEEQTEANLGRIATAYNSVASLIANNSALAIVDDTIMGLVETLNSILQWEPEVLAANGSNIVEDFEIIAAAFADRGEGIVFTTPDIAFVAENQDIDVLQNNGRSFSTSNNDSAPDPATGDAMTPDTLAPNQTAFINLPASLFDSVPEDRPNIGVFFALYDNPSLFPVAEAEVENSTRVVTVLSPVIAATVGPGLFFMDLDPPVSILLRLQELGENDTMLPGSERCVSWDFEANGGEGNWTTEGCETIGVEDGVVTCQCNHLTNFAILVDICSRINGSDCTPPPALTKALEVLTIIGVSLSLFGLVMTIITLLVFKKLRERDASKYHVQLCIAMICMLLVFITGINRTAVYGGCVLVSVLIHYFTLVAVLWMTAEALLMFQKLVIVFTRITTKFIILVSILCWTIPIVPVIIPLIVDLTTRPEQDIVVNRDQFCFLNHPGAFFGAFLGPIFALLIFNVIIFIWVIVILVRHTKGGMKRQQQGMNKETAIRLTISITGVMFLFGLTWLFGALTITVTAVNLLFQVLFVFFNSLQGFFIFLFFCVFSREARESWKEVLSCGRYKSEFLHPSQAKITSSSNTVNRNKKLRTASTGLDATSSPAKSYNDDTLSNNTLDHRNEYSDIPMVSIDETSEIKRNLAAEDIDPSTAQIFESRYQPEHDETQHTNSDLAAQNGTGSGTAAEGGTGSLKPLKARVKRFSTKIARKHHVETMEVDFSDSDDSDGMDLGLVDDAGDIQFA